MSPEQQILDKWIAACVGSQPRGLPAPCATEAEQFRNPVAYAIRQSLSQLWNELCGEMNPSVLDRALDAILRIRAVQDVSPGQAIGFVLELRPLLHELPSSFEAARLDARIDQLTLAAFDKYVQCREQIAAVRAHETERLTRPARLAHGGVRS